MGERELTSLYAGGHFFEGPRWRDGRWYVSDFYDQAVYAVREDGRSEEVMRVAQQPSGLGWLPDGSLLVVSMRDHRLLRRAPDGEVTVHADLSEHCGGHLNDLVVDAQGRAFVGNFGFDLMAGGDPAYARLVRVDPDGAVTVAADELMFPNGAVIDGDTLIVAETMGGRLTGFTIADDGTLTDRSVWAQLSPTPELGPLGEMLAAGGIAPDGIALDAEGHVWAADAMGGPTRRIAPGGEIVDEIRPPAGMGVFACALGGADGRTLLLCSAPDFAEAARKGGARGSALHHDPGGGRVITLERAVALISAGQRAAAADGLALAFAVVDPGGHLVALHRMDGAPWIATEVALGKAWTAAAYGAPSAAQGEKMAELHAFSAAISAATGGRYTPQIGGLPITDGDTVIGAMGASGGTGQQDEDAVRAALQA